jgi:alpha-glucosidase
MTFRTTALMLAMVMASLGCAGTKKASPYQPDTSTLAAGHQLENAADWYRDAVIYQVWVKAFADGLYDDQIGDLPGLRSKLDYLQSLGVNTIWLSPIFECALKGDTMHGYDTTDYYAINDRFGKASDLGLLIDDVHARGMRILFDFVPNHTSASHPWFTDAATRNTYYIRRSDVPAGWALPWGGGISADVWKAEGGSYFYSAFATNTMADLNFYNPAVQTTMRNVARYWLDRGFDGMRVDAVRYLCETGPGAQADTADTHGQLQAFRAVLDEYATGDLHPHPGNDPARHSAKMMIAEAWTNDATGVKPYYGSGTNEFHLCLDFSAPWAIANAISKAGGKALTDLWEYEQNNYPAGYRTATFDSNHDNVISRPATQYHGVKSQIILHEALNLLAPGTPIIYYGNEVGMTGQSGNDTNLRQPMDWAAAATQATQPDSILSWCKYLIQARTAYPALRGTYATLATDAGPSKAVAYLMTAGSERIAVVANLTGSTQTLALTDLTAHGVAAGAPVQAVLGDLKNVTALAGTQYAVTALPPYGVRVLYLSGAGFRATLHGDLP